MVGVGHQRDRLVIESFASQPVGVARIEAAYDQIQIAAAQLRQQLFAGALDQADLRAKMLLQVHDELVFEIPEAERAVAAALVKREMEGVASLRVPLVVSVGAGKNWIDAKG